MHENFSLNFIKCGLEFHDCFIICAFPVHFFTDFFQLLKALLFDLAVASVPRSLLSGVGLFRAHVIMSLEKLFRKI